MNPKFKTFASPQRPKYPNRPSTKRKLPAREHPINRNIIERRVEISTTRVSRENPKCQSVRAGGEAAQLKSAELEGIGSKLAVQQTAVDDHIVRDRAAAA
jgi:hypothetical protein